MANRKSFTLVELLVVIAIIAILAAVVMLAINPLEMMRRGRDSARLRDLDNVRKAIDMAIAADAASLPTIGGTLVYRSHTQTDQRCFTSCGTSPQGWVCGINICTYLAALPRDPTNNANFHYAFKADGNYYELNAVLESDRNNSLEENDGGNNTAVYEIGNDPGLDLI